ncbi:MAG: peptide chain release factor N(5)-glutamine methyltransferase [Clostridia bacterium]|nr:peptide chain release factor N(5)-glutamine methyltransferase [Clostridia bacterium]
MLTVGDLLRTLRLALTESGIEAARHEAALLIATRCDLSLARVYSHPEKLVTPQQTEQLRADLRRRIEHEPIAYILGQTEFYGLAFSVGPGVLIPRSDTERLVEVALEQIETHFPPGQMLHILDTCTGTGCVGISVAARLAVKGRAFQLDLVDQDPVAIEFARANAQRHQPSDRVHVFQADLWPDPAQSGHERYDVILANPPYIVQTDVPGLMPDVSLFEPWIALDGGADGLDFYRRLTLESARWLKRPGLLLLEHGFDQALAVEDLCVAAGLTDRLAVCDYGGHPRVTGGWLHES